MPTTTELDVQMTEMQIDIVEIKATLSNMKGKQSVLIWLASIVSPILMSLLGVGIYKVAQIEARLDSLPRYHNVGSAQSEVIDLTRLTGIFSQSGLTDQKGYDEF